MLLKNFVIIPKPGLCPDKIRVHTAIHKCLILSADDLTIITEVSSQIVDDNNSD